MIQKDGFECAQISFQFLDTFSRFPFYFLDFSPKDLTSTII